MPQLLAIAEYITKTLAICMVCGAPANHTQRLVASSERVLVGAQGTYEARCRHCFDPQARDSSMADDARLQSAECQLIAMDLLSRFSTSLGAGFLIVNLQLFCALSPLPPDPARPRSSPGRRRGRRSIGCFSGSARCSRF